MAVEGLTPGPAGGQPPFSFAGVHTRPDFDLIELLPPAAAEKLRTLRQRSLDLHAIIPPFEEVRQASIARSEAASALRRLTDHQQLGGFNLPQSAPQVVAAQRTLDKATATFEELQARQAARSAAWQAASAVPANIETWLRDGRPQAAALEDIETPAVKLNKGEGLLDAVARLQRRARELKADQRRIEAAPWPSTHARAKMRAEIEQLSQRGAPDVSLLIEMDRSVVWPTQRVQSEVHGTEQRAIAFTETLDALAIVAWLHKDALIAALDREIGSEADDKSALTPEQREIAEAEVMADLLDIERQEAALTWRALSEKLPVEFRSGIAPQAVLGLNVVTKPNGHQEPTSWMHGWDVVRPGGR